MIHLLGRAVGLYGEDGLAIASAPSTVSTQGPALRLAQASLYHQRKENIRQRFPQPRLALRLPVT